MEHKLKVLIVDDSLVYRKILTEAVEETGLGQVVHTASNGEIALERLEQSRIDVVLLDVYMPDIDGIETLDIIKKRYPEKPVIMISSGGTDSAELTVKALEMGAMDFILKPSDEDLEKNRQRIKSYLHILFAQILTKRYSEAFRGRMEATAAAIPHKRKKPDKTKRDKPGKPLMNRGDKKVRLDEVDIILIASSAGGPVALEKIFGQLPSKMNAPILVVQHMPPTFTKMLAQTLNRKSKITIEEGTAGDKIEPNKAFLAPGGTHMVVKEKNCTNMVIDLEDTPQVHGVRPAADVLFSSVAKAYRGRNVLVIILTGMGSDGAQGVKELKAHSNCYCITQSEESCVVYGMPKSVYEAGLSDEVANIDKIAGRIIDIVSGRG